ncbi:YvaD family protein [Paenibacillus sp. FSL H8-0457]|uniref:YvaD family protein n=1 Tax=unclassified Paenibacillus TaxID=185978 RepID=UPI0003E27FB6|nr:YvaD family protein [Paenibacillus sp. FSL H8-457]ETT62247.1 YvaD [Paenibacillus sp. FSL H8-457]
MGKTLKGLFLVTDIGFIMYWVITALAFIPKEYLYQDYTNELLVIWNWSFFPLDIFISVTGMYSLYLHKRRNAKWKNLALISLTLTFCSGLQAIVFWIIKSDFDLMWWVSNLYLLLYPLFFIPKLLETKEAFAES